MQGIAGELTSLSGEMDTSINLRGRDLWQIKDGLTSATPKAYFCFHTDR